MSAHPSNFTTAVGLRTGDKIDKYEVVAQIGAGGFSVVWKAYDRLLDKHVAVKQITVDQSVDEETFRERFRAEAAIQKKAAQDHKHLVRIIDFIEDPRGLFIIMEYVDGPSLEHMLSQNPGPVDVKTALGVAAAAAVALGALHEQGIVHRDLKPGNILLPAAGGLKICDFGLAALMKDQETPAVGTVRYMAPELLNAQQVDGRADIYSLGFMLYEMLIGRANFEDAFKIVLRDQRNVALRWMKWHTNLKVKAPPIRQYVPAVPEAIAQLVERMMEKDANQRIASAPQLLDAMRRQLAGAAAGPAAPGKAAPLPHAVATPGAVGDKTVKLKKSNKLVIIAAVTIMVWTVLGLGYLMYTKNQAAKAEQAKRDVVRDDYMAALKEFDAAVKGQGDWDKTALAFKSVLQKHENYRDLPVPVTGNARKPLAEAVEGHRLFCEGRREYDARRFDNAVKLLQDAEKTGAVNLEMTNRLISDAGVFGAIDEVEKLILAHVAKEEWFPALNLWGKNRPMVMNLSNEHREHWDDLKRKIDQLQLEASARNVLAKAKEMEPTDPGGALEYVKQEIAKNPNRVLEAYVRTLEGQIEYANSKTRGLSAETRSEYDLAIASFEKAMLLNATTGEKDGLPTKIRKLKGRVWVDKGKKAAEEDNNELALECYQKALLDDPENEDAKRAISQMAASDKIKSLRRLAVTNFETKEYEKAITIWKQLRDEFNGDPVEIGAEITKCEMQIALRNMEAAWLSGNDAETLKAIDAVLALDPAHERALLLKNLIDTRRRIRVLIGNGLALRDKVEYGSAKLEIRRAIDIAKSIPDQSIREQLLSDSNKALDEVEYIDCFTKAKRDLELDKLQTASAWAKSALRAKSTPEAKDLLARIEAALAKKPPAP